MEETLVLFLGLYAFLFILFYKVLRIEQKIGAVGRRVGYYEPTITLWKFVQQLIFGGASYLIIEYVSSFYQVIQEWKLLLIILTIATLNALNNYIKHR